MPERTDAITKEVLEPITFVIAYPTVWGNTDLNPLILSLDTAWRLVKLTPRPLFNQGIQSRQPLNKLGGPNSRSVNSG
jgi:hypothetical protein